ncbi:MAG: hypothetical protein ACLSUW_00855 [Akkermansia sp.]
MNTEPKPGGGRQPGGRCQPVGRSIMEVATPEAARMPPSLTRHERW